jgi:hypothetical protein
MKLRILIFSIFFCPVMLAAQGLDTAKIDEAMGRSGQKTGDVYRLGFPRTDLHVSIAGVDIKPGLALGSWAAFAGNDNDAMVMGDLSSQRNRSAWFSGPHRWIAGPSRTETKIAARLCPDP